jgi:hypothetical protein
MITSDDQFHERDTFSSEPRSVDEVTSVIEVEQFARGAMHYGGRVGPYFVALSIGYWDTRLAEA